MQDMMYQDEASILRHYSEQQSNTRYQLDLRADLWEFRLNLQALIRNPNFEKELEAGVEAREYLEVTEARLVNEKGAVSIYHFMNTMLNKTLFNTNFNDKTISKETEMFDDKFSEWLAVNHVDFDLSDKNYEAVCEQAVVLYKAGINNSIKGWKGELLNAQGTSREVYYQNNPEDRPQGKRKIFGIFGG